MENISKNAKVIGIGNDGIDNLVSIYNVLQENVDTEKIGINQDVDKEYVRQLLDGVDMLFLTYSTEDKRAVDIVKAISFMASERRVLSIGLNSSQKENKDELGLNQEFVINDENFNELMGLMNLMVEAVSDECVINIDLTDLKELFSGDGGVKYTCISATKDESSSEIVEKLLSTLKEVKSDFISKKGIVFVETNNDDSILFYLNEILGNLDEKLESTYELIFSLYLKENNDNKIKIGLIFN